MRDLIYLIIPVLVVCCQPKSNQESYEQPEEPKRVELTTSMGKITLELSDKTPLHRDNFIKIVNEGHLDSMLFHRVLEDFVVQAGQYDSTKRAKMDSTVREALDYRVPAEFDTSLFHKRGALGAARTGNPERESSSLSFYFVHRGPRSDSLIEVDQKRINDWLQANAFINAPQNQVWKDSLLAAEDDGNWQLFSQINDTINAMAKTYEYNTYTIPKDQLEIYRTLGGTPHLDQNYTVFGEIVQGMAVVDSIAVVDVNNAGRPNDNVYILSARVLD